MSAKDDMVYVGHMLDMAHKHDYMSVDEDILWDTVNRELKPLVGALDKIMPTEGSATV